MSRARSSIWRGEKALSVAQFAVDSYGISRIYSALMPVLQALKLHQLGNEYFAFRFRADQQSEDDAR
jgi:hypothetical protein